MAVLAAVTILYVGKDSSRTGLFKGQKTPWNIYWEKDTHACYRRS